MKNDKKLKELYYSIEDALKDWCLYKQFDTLDFYKYNKLGRYILNNYPNFINCSDDSDDYQKEMFTGCNAFFELSSIFGRYKDDERLKDIYYYNGHEY